MSTLSHPLPFFPVNGSDVKTSSIKSVKITANTTVTNYTIPVNSTMVETSNLSSKNASKTNLAVVGGIRKSNRPSAKEEVTFHIKNRGSKVVDLPTKAYARDNYSYYESGITNVRHQEVHSVVKKTIPRVNNFAFYDSNNDIYKEKGEEIETTYTSKRGRKYRTICKSPKVNSEPMIIVEKKPVQTITIQRQQMPITSYKNDHNGRPSRGNNIGDNSINNISTVKN